MTPWLSGLRVTGLLIALGAGVVVSPYGAVPSYGAESAPAAGRSASSAVGHSASAAEPSRAGNRADEGHHRPRWREEHAPHGLMPPYRAEGVPVGRASASPSASAAEPSRAGSLAGEGRQRPGRPEEPTAQDEPRDEGEDAEVPGDEEVDNTEGDVAEDATAVPQPSRDAGMPSGPPTGPAEQNVAHPGSPAGPTLQILPLGSGLILVGLGLGLAFLGLRLRRGQDLY